MSDEARVQRFEDLIAWQKARALVTRVTALTETPPISRKFAFRDQIERSAISIMSNIAEGYERGSRAEFHHFLSISKCSCAEVRSLLYVALDAKYVDQSTFAELDSLARETSRVIGGLPASVARLRDADRNR